eukprot:m.308799 g.308799  ORF g.308799 m.308799 type:complete len:684 (+) comp44828_c0_seq1:14-2065(+)
MASKGALLHFGSKPLDKAFEEAEHLGSLFLSGRNLRNLSCSDGYDIFDVTEADLTKNRLIEMPYEICSCSSLERLICHHNAIRSIPDTFLQLMRLTYLDISRNQLSSLPPSICLWSLETLIVSSNRLNFIPGDIGKMSNLVELDAGNNELRSLPLEIGKLTKLRCLKLRRNSLTELPDCLSCLKLVHLDVTANYIKAIPTSFAKMATLSIFLLEHNPVMLPPPEVCSRGLVHLMKYLHRRVDDQHKPQRSNSSRRSRTEVRMGRRFHEQAASSPTPLQQRYSVSLTAEIERAEETIAQKHGLDSWRRPGSGSKRNEEKIVTTSATASLPHSPPLATESTKPLEKEGFVPYRPGSSHSHKPEIVVDSSKKVAAETTQSQRPIEREMSKAEALRVTTSNSTGKRSSPTKEVDGQKSGRGGSPRLGQRKTVRKTSDSSIDDKKKLENLKEQERQQNKKLQRLAAQDGKGGKTAPPSKVGVGVGEPSIAWESKDKPKELRPKSPRQPVKRRPASHRGSPTPPSPGLKYKPSDPGPQRPLFMSKSLPRSKQSFKLESKTNFTVRRKEINVYEGIQRMEEMRVALESRLGITLPEDLTSALSDGIVLCNMVNRIRPLTIQTIYTRAGEGKLTTLKAQKNVDAFLDGCRKLGVPESHLCSPADILHLDERDPLKVCLTVETLLLPGDTDI